MTILPKGSLNLILRLRQDPLARGVGIEEANAVVVDWDGGMLPRSGERAVADTSVEVSCSVQVVGRGQGHRRTNWI